jgi:hypothetical protein
LGGQTRTSEEAIVPDDRSDPASSSSPGTGSSAERKAKPPVIELTATDVTPKSEKEAEQETGKKPGKPSGGPGQSRAGSSEANAARETGMAARQSKESKLLPVLAGVIGLLAGALVLSLVVLFAGDGARRLFA